MALLPLLGALIVSQAPAQYQIQSQVLSGNKIELSGKSSFRAKVDDEMTILEGVDSKALFKENKLQKLFSPTLRVLEGQQGEVRLEGASMRESLTLKYTAKTETSGSVLLHTDFDLNGALTKGDFLVRLGETYYVMTKSRPARLVLIKVDRISD